MRVLGVFLLWTSVCVAQQVTPLVPRKEPQPRIIVKFALPSLIEQDPTIQGAIEYRLKSRLSMQQELGFMHISQWMNVSEKYPRSIFRSRSEVRYYLSRHKKEMERGYLALEGFYEYMSQPSDGWINRGSYFELQQYTYIKHVAGGHMKLGIQTFPGERDRFVFDGYLGLGIRSIWRDVKGTNVSLEQTPDDPFDALSLGGGRSHYWMPSLSFGFKLGYLFYVSDRADE